VKHWVAAAAVSWSAGLPLAGVAGAAVAPTVGQATPRLRGGMVAALQTIPPRNFDGMADAEATSHTVTSIRRHESGVW